ncbi:MAG: thiamine-phosphate kinase [Pseudomonadales bacterium]|nr:thiamine-phosphate kinase [Pseudomonadales bacterium]
MSLSEFDIIARYFKQSGLIPASDSSTCPLGIGDDCALLDIPPGKRLAVSMDILVADVHFPGEADPARIAQRALAVNLSDLAAMGASPLAFTLGLSLPEARPEWLAGFSRGLASSAGRYGCPLIGGDLVKGALSVCIQVHGLVDRGREIRRSGAQPGDLVLVSGTLGDAGLALELIQGRLAASAFSTGERAWLEAAYYQPSPRLALGQALCGLATAGIDISDGLLADLGHIAAQSGVGMTLQAHDLPLSPLLRKTLAPAQALACALGAGDDYELAFTLPSAQLARLQGLQKDTGTSCTVIGRVVAGSGVQCLDEEGRMVRQARSGYEHFQA